MAYIPEDETPQPSRVTRVTQAITAPVTAFPRYVLLLAVGAAAAAMAPAPLDSIGAACYVLAVYELGRKR